MSSSTIEFVSPFGLLAKKHGTGLAYVINEIVTNNAGAAPPIEQLMSYVVDYLKAEYSITDRLTEQALTAALGNTVNRYLAGSSAGAIGWVGLDSVPPTSLDPYLTRLEQNIIRTKSISDPVSNRMLAIAIGRNDLAYWETELANPSSDWAPFFNGNLAIDTATLPYWVGASMRGSAVGFNQLKACDTPGTMNHLMSALGGNIILAAGRVLYGWEPKRVAARRPLSELNPTGPSPAFQINIICDDGFDETYEVNSQAAAESALGAVQASTNAECCLV